MDGTVFGAPADELAKAGEVPRPATKFDLTDDEVAALARVLAEDYERDDSDPDRSPATSGQRAFRAAKIDLDGDGVEEFLMLFADGYHCGSGGCTFRVYARNGGPIRRVSGSTITRMPVAVAEAETQGWRDLTVFVCGGGIDPCTRSKLKFDGSSYPMNPSMPPAQRTDEVGTVVLAEASPIHLVPRPQRGP
jgi:hypothetical protein